MMKSLLFLDDILLTQKKTSWKEASDYQYYWNFERLHTWKFMNNLTPTNRAYSHWIYNINALRDFPLLILQDHYLILDKIKKSQNVLTYYLFIFYKSSSQSIVQVCNWLISSEVKYFST